MKQKNLYLLCGIPGAGKTTWAYNNSKDNGIVFSRDEIRNELIEKDRDFNFREDKVFEIFITRINSEILEGENLNIFIDSTHHNEFYRNKILDSLFLGSNINIYPVNFDISLKTCLAQNDLRTGKAYVPKESIQKLYNIFTPASKFDKYGYLYKDILTVKEE